MIVKGKIIGYFHIFFLHIRNVIDLGSKTLKTKKSEKTYVAVRQMEERKFSLVFYDHFLTCVEGPVSPFWY